MGEPIVGGRPPGRNELCPCRSGLKWKHCHGDEQKRDAVQGFANAFMARLIEQGQMKKGLRPWPFTCQACGRGFTQPVPSKIAPGVVLCPYCDGGITKNETPMPESEPSIIIGGNE